MKFGTCNEYFEGWKLEEVFDYAAEVGYDGVVAVHQSPLEGESIEHCARATYEHLTSVGEFAPRA